MLRVDIDRVSSYVTMNEAYRRDMYYDSEGIPTIGIGFNLLEGFSMEECVLILKLRLTKLVDEVSRAIPCFRDLCQVRKIVLLDMAYNLGVPKLLRFKRMLAALDRGDYQLAAKEMLDSQYASQVKGRARRNAQMMETGEWYE